LLLRNLPFAEISIEKIGEQSNYDRTGGAEHGCDGADWAVIALEPRPAAMPGDLARTVPGELIPWQVLELCNIVTFSSPDRLDFSFLFLNVTDLKGIRAGRHFRSG
jgi:hypothetical protein